MWTTIIIYPGKNAKNAFTVIIWPSVSTESRPFCRRAKKPSENSPSFCTKKTLPCKSHWKQKSVLGGKAAPKKCKKKHANSAKKKPRLQLKFPGGQNVQKNAKNGFAYLYLPWSKRKAGATARLRMTSSTMWQRGSPTVECLTPAGSSVCLSGTRFPQVRKGAKPEEREPLAARLTE